jgi:hypothetical protein
MAWRLHAATADENERRRRLIGEGFIANNNPFQGPINPAFIDLPVSQT